MSPVIGQGSLVGEAYAPIDQCRLTNDKELGE